MVESLVVAKVYLLVEVKVAQWAETLAALKVALKGNC